MERLQSSKCAEEALTALWKSELGVAPPDKFNPNQVARKTGRAILNALHALLSKENVKILVPGRQAPKDEVMGTLWSILYPCSAKESILVSATLLATLATLWEATRKSGLEAGAVRKAHLEALSDEDESSSEEEAQVSKPEGTDRQIVEGTDEGLANTWPESLELERQKRERELERQNKSREKERQGPSHERTPAIVTVDAGHTPKTGIEVKSYSYGGGRSTDPVVKTLTFEPSRKDHEGSGAQKQAEAEPQGGAKAQNLGTREKRDGGKSRESAGTNADHNPGAEAEPRGEAEAQGVGSEEKRDGGKSRGSAGKNKDHNPSGTQGQAKANPQGEAGGQNLGVSVPLFEGDSSSEGEVEDETANGEGVGASQGDAQFARFAEVARERAGTGNPSGDQGRQPEVQERRSRKKEKRASRKDKAPREEDTPQRRAEPVQSGRAERERPSREEPAGDSAEQPRSRSRRSRKKEKRRARRDPSPEDSSSSSDSESESSSEDEERKRRERRKRRKKRKAKKKKKSRKKKRRDRYSSSSSSSSSDTSSEDSDSETESESDKSAKKRRDKVVRRWWKEFERSDYPPFIHGFSKLEAADLLCRALSGSHRTVTDYVEAHKEHLFRREYEEAMVHARVIDATFHALGVRKARRSIAVEIAVRRISRLLQVGEAGWLATEFMEAAAFDLVSDRNLQRLAREKRRLVADGAPTSGENYKTAPALPVKGKGAKGG